MPTCDIMQVADARSKKQTTKQKQRQLTDHLRLVQQAVKAANEETDILQHLPAFRTFSKNTVAASITFAGAAQLDASQKQAMWTLFKSNMEDFYRRDSQKWNPKEKQRELFHDDARFFVASDTDGRLLGFTHFRFEVEENILVEEELVLNRLERYDPVLYCYELQLDPSVHRHGLGRRLMQMLELTALRFKMHMVLLTVQRSNVAALAFYKSAGYKQHPSCPERNGFDDFDGVDPGHRIMWKDLRRS